MRSEGGDGRPGNELECLPGASPRAHRGPSPDPEGLRAAAAARFVGVGRSTWLRWVSSGRAPRGLKIGGVRIWPRRELQSWLEADAPPAERWESQR